MQPFVAPIRLTEFRPARIVREGRELAGWSQAALARRAGISRDALARLEGEHGGTKVRDLEAVLRALDEGGVCLRPDGRPDLRDAPRWATR